MSIALFIKAVKSMDPSNLNDEAVDGLTSAVQYFPNARLEKAVVNLLTEKLQMEVVKEAEHTFMEDFPLEGAELDKCPWNGNYDFP